MEQLNLTTIPTTALSDTETDDEDERLFQVDRLAPTASLSSLDVRENGLSPAETEDKEWLIKSQRGRNVAELKREHKRRADVSADRMEKILRMLAMACACTFGVGSHFSSHIIGPLKGILMERLNLTNTQFSLLIASLTLCNTVIPIVSGLLIAKVGTTNSSIVVTTVILIGMIVVTAASWSGQVWAMIVGFAVFGMGLAPLTIIQETIIVQFFQGNGLGFALASGLTVGKLASFLASITAVPLSLGGELSYRTPFIVATFTCFLSWVMNIVYLFLLRHAGNRKGQGNDGALFHKVMEKKTVHWSAIFELSNMFWWYLVVVLLFGTAMPPFVHLSSNIIKHRFNQSDLIAAWDASLILLLPVAVYPFLGLFLDKYGKRCSILMAAAIAMLLTYLLLLLPTQLIHPFPPILFFAIAFALAPLTVVSLVPLLTEHVSTGLGLYKSLDNIGATLSQTVAGLVLDAHAKHINYTKTPDGIELGHEDDDLGALRLFAALSFLCVVATLIFWWQDKTYENGRINSRDDGSNYHDTVKYGHLGDEEVTNGTRMMVMEDDTNYSKEALMQRRKRSTIYVGLLILLLAICWGLFAVVAVKKANVHRVDPGNNSTVTAEQDGL